jgi:ABC-type Fe3+ transport system permease subunit
MAAALSPLLAASVDTTNTVGWHVGYIVTIVVVLVVVALVVPILVLAYQIGNQAKDIDDSLKDSVRNTAALAGLRTTIRDAEVITAGLNRGRTRLGG